jgi:hypothetical protein
MSPDLDQLLAPPPKPTALANSQAWEATVVQVTPRGAYVQIPKYDPKARWGPCLPAGAGVKVGDAVAVAFSNRGRPWLVGGAGYEDPNIDGGAPSSTYGGNLPNIDGGGV